MKNKSGVTCYKHKKIHSIMFTGVIVSGSSFFPYLLEQGLKNG